MLALEWHGESNWLGWLTIAEEQLANIDALKRIAEDAKKRDSSMRSCWGWVAPPLSEVLRMTFGKIKGFPELHVLDSTTQRKSRHRSESDLRARFCIVSSKSGSTLEPNIYKQYFSSA